MIRMLQLQHSHLLNGMYVFPLQWRHNERHGVTGVSIVCSTIFSGTGQRKYQSSASLAITRHSNADNYSNWWRHHALCWVMVSVIFGQHPTPFRCVATENITRVPRDNEAVITHMGILTIWLSLRLMMITKQRELKPWSNSSDRLWVGILKAITC